MGEVNRLVMVEWTDASYERGEVLIEDMKPLARLATVGFLCREDEHSISIAGERSLDDRCYRHVNHIPRSGIIKLTYI